MPTETTLQERGARVAVEELTGLALQERGLTTLLARQAAEAPYGGPRERLEAHLAQSRRHAQIFDDHVRRLSAHRGPAELAVGLLRSGAAAIGTVGATVAQLATAPLALARQGGREERLLENAGVEGGVVANKLVILTAVSRSSALSAHDDTARAIARVRDETRETLDDLLEQTPEMMSALVHAKAAA